MFVCKLREGGNREGWGEGDRGQGTEEVEGEVEVEEGMDGRQDREQRRGGGGWGEGG